AKMVRGLTGRWPLPIVNYTDRAMTGALVDLLRREKFELVHIDAIHLAGCESALRAALGSTPVFYNWHNIESEYLERYAGETPGRARRWYARHTARQLYRVESAILESARGHIVCSERERAMLARRAPAARVAVIENGVAIPPMHAVESKLATRGRILFVGSMAYPANAHAAVWFTREIWPRIREGFPHFRFSIVGYNPLPEVLALRDLPGVEVTGTVPDVAPWYEGAFASIVPVRIAGGTRLKILEAMAAGVPVVSTKLGAEGLAVSPGENILIAESVEDWRAAMGKLGDPATWNRQAGAARALVEARYDWQEIGRTLVETYRSWLQTQ
ncbi:MAG TPA: glycosyltransferase family 4 protein, partial [Bryobacteraceae bacterium]|nr:glycosyltransferase family 4 protein [Bryobacteraceae bacterium]